jgi:N5-(carboxyethyl)ornithine synthase
MDNPIYEIDGIFHYAVDHTPSIFYKTISKSLSEEVSKFIDSLIEDNMSQLLRNALIVENGNIIDQRINQFQGR